MTSPDAPPAGYPLPWRLKPHDWNKGIVLIVAANNHVVFSYLKEDLATFVVSRINTSVRPRNPDSDEARDAERGGDA